MNIEYRFPSELHLLPDPAKPELAIGWIEGLADINIVQGGYVIADVWCSNTAEYGKGHVLIDRHSPLFTLLCESIRFQFDGLIRDRINDELDQVKDEIGGTYRAREYGHV